MIPFESLDKRLLPGFERRRFFVEGQPVLAVVGGKGPPLLMLHGDPQTHLCWHHLAPRLSERFTVVLADLRGRGETHKPADGPGHEAYSKRAMAREQLAVMRSLGFSSFRLVGHDRGARVARRLALDHPEAVEKLVVMDIVPALDFYDQADAAIAQDYVYFFFLTQPQPLPESLIAGDPEGFMAQILTGLSPKTVPYDVDALDLYIKSASTPDAVAAMCACFRAGLHVDRAHDAQDRRSGRTISCPALVLWGEEGVVGQRFDVRRIWNNWCDDVRFAPMPSGHFIPEEAPEATLAALDGFL